MRGALGKGWLKLGEKPEGESFEQEHGGNGRRERIRGGHERHERI